MKSAHEEMDNIIVQQAVAAANEKKKSISVFCQDTDVFVLLFYHYLAKTRQLSVIMESPQKDSKNVDLW